jgi:hypothetical protein
VKKGNNVTALSTHTSDPEHAIACFEDAPDEVSRDAVIGRVALELSLFHADKTSAFGADPQRTVAGFPKRANVGTFQLRRVLGVEHRELDSIEPGDAVLSSDPNISVTRLANCLHYVLRQSIFKLPGIVEIKIAGRRRCGWCGAKCRECKGKHKSVQPPFKYRHSTV